MPDIVHFSLGEIADRVDGFLLGDRHKQIGGVALIDEADENQISFVGPKVDVIH